jgi:hypothetical protein
VILVYLFVPTCHFVNFIFTFINDLLYLHMFIHELKMLGL